MNLNNSTETKNEEDALTYLRSPKKIRLLLSGNERSLFYEMYDFQRMIDQQNKTKGKDFPMSISYICKNMNITDKTAQSLINRLIELNLINKNSGYRTRTKNTYTINFDKVYEFNRMSNKQMFELRDELKKTKLAKAEEPIELEELLEQQCIFETEKLESPIEILKAMESESEVKEYVSDDSGIFQEDIEDTEDDVFSRFENYFDTYNNGLLHSHSDCIDAMPDNFTDEEIQYVRSNRKIFFENCKLSYNTKRSLDRELLFYTTKEKEKEIGSPNF